MKNTFFDEKHVFIGIFLFIKNKIIDGKVKKRGFLVKKGCFLACQKTRNTFFYARTKSAGGVQG
jgi:hypothetical protein